MKAPLPYIETNTIKRGDRSWTYLFVRIGGKRVRLRNGPSSSGFLAEYNAAVARLKPASDAATPPGHPKPGTMGELSALWFGSAAFQRAEPTTQRRRRSTVEGCLQEPLKPEDPNRTVRDVPVAAFTAAHVRTLRDRKAARMGAANQRIKVLSALFSWAIEAGQATSNPCRDVKKIAYASDGFYTWTREDIAKFVERHPLGTKAHLALALLLYTGVRRSDAVLIGRQHIRGDSIVFVPAKTKKKKPTPLTIPLLPVLREVIEATPHSAECLTILETEWSRPYASGNAFGNKVKDWCIAAGLPECSAHGLRKLAAVSMAEAGATVQQLMASFGWSTPAQAIRYIEKASQAKMAAAAMPLIGRIG